MLVVLIIMSLVLTGVAVFGFGFSAEIKKQAFEEEAKTVCRFFNDSRKIAMLTETNAVLDIEEDQIVRHYLNGKDTLKLRELKLRDYKDRDYGQSQYWFVEQMTFSSAGTISVGATYLLKGSGGNHCYLIIQPVTGRMYLNAKPPK